MTILKINLYVALPFWTMLRGHVWQINIKEEYNHWEHSYLIEQYNKKLSAHVCEVGDEFYQIIKL